MDIGNNDYYLSYPLSYQAVSCTFVLFLKYPFAILL